jgi:hypothetical protein
MIRQCADKFLEALRRAVAHSTTLDEILLGVIFGLILLMILNFLGLFK